MLEVHLVRSCKAALARLLIERREVMACLLHHLHHAVERYGVCAVREGSVQVGVKGACGCEGVALDSGNLDETANGVAGHAEVVFQSHLRCILNLRRAAAEQLAGCG